MREQQETRTIEGSLDVTAAAAIVAKGERRAFLVAMDLLDRPSIDAMVDTVVGKWGIDALINNVMTRAAGRPCAYFTSTPRPVVVGNDNVNQLHLIQLVVPGMLERGSGLLRTWRRPRPPWIHRRPWERAVGVSATARRRPRCASPGSCTWKFR